MVLTCCAFGCSEKYRKNSNISFHTFPKDPFRRKQWEVKLRRENFVASNSSKICSKHFSIDCFDTQKLGGRWLKSDAVPTIFIFSPQMLEEKKKSPESALCDKQPIVIKLTSKGTPLSKKRKCENEQIHTNKSVENINTNKSLKNVTTNERLQYVNTTNKRLEHLGFTEEDIKIHSKACMFLSIAKAEYEKDCCEMKTLHQKVRRLKTRIVRLLDQIDELQS